MTGQSENAALDLGLDRGPRGRERSRLCAATRTVHPVSELIRFVIGPNGEAVADVKSKLPGRGIWITATRQALGAAIKKIGRIARIRRRATTSPNLLIRR